MPAFFVIAKYGNYLNDHLGRYKKKGNGTAME